MAKRKPRAKSKPGAQPRATKPRPKRKPKGGGPGAISPRPRDEPPIEFIARGVWLHGSRVLLCRNLDKGYLYLPGGHVEFGESAGDAVEREFLEECAERVTSGPLALVTEGVFDTRKRRHHEVNLVFHVEHSTSGKGSAPERPIAQDDPPTVQSREDGIGFEWVDLAAAVDLDIRPLAVKAWLAAGCGGGAKETGTEAAPARAEWVSEVPRGT